MANPGLIKQTTLEAATEGVQVITKAFEREIMEDAGQLGWFVDVTNDTFAFMRPDRDFKGFLFGAGGADTWDMGLKRLGSELMSFRNYPDDDDQVDFRVRELQASRIPHANVKAWGATGDGTTDDRSAISNALTELKTAGGGELFLPPGTFRMSTGISESDLKGITIRGAGITTTTIKLDDVAVRHFIFTGSEGITFKDLTFQGAGSTTASNVGSGVNMPLGSNSFNEGHRFENVQFLGMSDIPVEIPSARGLVMSNIKIEDCNLDMIDLDSPFSASLSSLLLIGGQQRGLYVHGGGKDVGVYASRAFQCGIGFEVDAAAVVFSGVTAEDGQNRSASFPGYGFVAGDTISLVTLLNTCVISTAGITPYVENNGASFEKLNARTIMAGVTTTESPAGGGGIGIGGTPVNNQIAVWTGADELEGDTGFVWNGVGLVVVQGGIGNALDVKRAAGSVSARFITFGAGIAQQASFVFGKSATDSIDVFAETADNESLGQFTWEGVNSSNSAFGAASFSAEQDGAAGARVPGRLIFKTTSASDALVERMRIDSVGFITIGGVVAMGNGISVSEFVADHGLTGGLDIITSVGGVLRLSANGTITGDELVGKVEFWSSDASTTSSRIGGHFGLYADTTWGSVHPEGMFQWHVASGTGAETERMRLDKQGRLGINDSEASPLAQVHIISNNVGFPGLIVDTLASATSPVAQLKSNGNVLVSFASSNDAGTNFFEAVALNAVPFDNGTGAGKRINLRRNNNSSTPAAAALLLEDKGGSLQYFWPDDSAAEGVLRQSTTEPTNANNTAGVVVGDQTSWYELKTNIESWDDGEWAIKRLMETDLHTFQFENCSRRLNKMMHGYVIYDRDAWYAMNVAPNQTPCLDETEVLGTLTAAVKWLAAAELKRRLNE